MKKILKLDYLLLLPLFITCTLGIIMMYSASSIVAASITVITVDTLLILN